MRSRSKSAFSIVSLIGLSAPWLDGQDQTGDAAWTAKPQPELATAITRAEPLAVENVSQPTRTVRHEAPIPVPNPGGGGPDVLVVYYKGYQGPATVFATDTNTGEVTRAEIPRGRNTHLQGSVIAGNGKRYATLQRVGGGLELWVYDPGTNEFSARETIGESLDLMGQGNRLVLGPEGLIYGTVGARATDGAGFFRIDPATDAAEVLGSGASIQGAPYVQGLAVAGDGMIYAVYGKTPYRLIEFDPDTQASREIATANPQGKIRLREVSPEEDGRVVFSILRAESGVENDGEYRIAGDGSVSRLGDAVSDRTDGKKSVGGGAAGKGDQKREFRRLISEGLTPKEAKEKILGFAAPGVGPARAGKKSAAGTRVRWAGLELDASRLDPAVNPDSLGRLRYRVAEEESWTTVAFDPPLYAEALVQLTTLPDGRLFGTATNRAGHFVHDPVTDETVFLGRTGLQHHSSAISGDRIYLSGYPSSMLWSWDFTGTPWVEPRPAKMGEGQFGSTPPADNPRRLGTLREFSGVHMATCATTDATGRVYFAGRWYRDGKGGGVGRWDPAKEETGGFWETLSNLQVADCCAVAEGKNVVLSTVRVADKVLDREAAESARLVVIDAETDPDAIAKTIIPLPGAVSTGLIAPAGGNRLIGVAPDPDDASRWLIYGVDVASGKMAFTKVIPGIPEGKIGSVELLHSYRNVLAVAPDGTIWMKHLGVLLRIRPEDAHVEVMGRPVIGEDARAGLEELSRDDQELIRTLGMIKADGAPATIGRMAFSGDDLYLTGTPWLRRIRNAGKDRK